MLKKTHLNNGDDIQQLDNEFFNIRNEKHDANLFNTKISQNLSIEGSELIKYYTRAAGFHVSTDSVKTDSDLHEYRESMISGHTLSNRSDERKNNSALSKQETRRQMPFKVLKVSGLDDESPMLLLSSPNAVVRKRKSTWQDDDDLGDMDIKKSITHSYHRSQSQESHEDNADHIEQINLEQFMKDQLMMQQQDNNTIVEEDDEGEDTPMGRPMNHRMKIIMASEKSSSEQQLEESIDQLKMVKDSSYYLD